VKTVSDKLVRH